MPFLRCYRWRPKLHARLYDQLKEMLRVELPQLVLWGPLVAAASLEGLRLKVEYVA